MSAVEEALQKLGQAVQNIEQSVHTIQTRQDPQGDMFPAEDVAKRLDEAIEKTEALLSEGAN